MNGTETVFERWKYWGYPELVEIRFRLPGVALRVEGWNLSVEEVCDLSAPLERLELASDLLRRMSEVATAAALAWETWHRERHPDAWPG